MDFLPDILDHLGKTPREFGALHAHFESVTTVDGTRVVARVLFQAAFDPFPAGAQIAFHAATSEGAKGDQLGCFIVPALGRSAIRVNYALRVPAGSTHVVAFLDAPEPQTRAERIRAPWKLFDTLEVPKLSDMEPVNDNRVGLNIAATVIGTAMLGGTGFFISFSTGTRLPATSKTTVHKARELPPGLVQAISSEVSAPVEGTAEETLWRPGEPLPPAPVVVYTPVAQKQGAVRWCRSCGFEGPAAEYERARSCPSCDEPWL
jgi:hypothetical protein